MPETSIGLVERSSHAGVHRVSAKVNDEWLWFESSDIALTPSREAFATAALLPSLLAGTRLTVAGALDVNWLRNTRALAGVLHELWGTPHLAPRATGHLPGGPNSVVPRDSSREQRTALCFTAGVDSFYSLLYSPYRPELLVFAHGYDIPLDDQTRMTALACSLREITASLGIRAAVIRTNLRAHRLFQGDWERIHGGAVAALGHLVDDHVRRLLISSSTPRWRDSRRVVGSNWHFDPLWSSSRLDVIHFGDRRSRLDKIAAIAAHPLAHRHLRVCWENRVPTGNCSKCAKCLKTMIALHRVGHLADFPVFDSRESVARGVQQLPSTRLIASFTDLLEYGLDSELHSAVTELVRRSQPPQPAASLMDRARRRLRCFLDNRLIGGNRVTAATRQ